MKKTKEHPWSLFADHVTLVTAKLGDRENAMPATWAVSVSFSPPLVAVSVAPERFTHDMIKESGRFGLCLLAEDQADLSRYAGSVSGRKADKLKKLKTFKGELDVPLPEGCVACLECEVVDEVKEGDHTIFIGRAVNTYSDESKKPLLFHKGSYYALGKSLGGY